MPTLGRADWHGFSLATTQALLRSDPVASITASWLWGGELTATVESLYARIRLDLYWPDLSNVNVVRYDADGTTSPVRNCEPLTPCTQTVIYDHEAPLDAACYYRMSPAGDDTGGWFSDPVTLTSGGLSWLKHPLKPSLNKAVHLYAMRERQLPARRGVARPIDRSDPIVMHQARLTDAGSVVIQTDGTWAENLAMRNLLADGDTLLLQQTATLAEGNLYLSVDTTGLDLLDEQAGWMLQRNWTLPFDVVARPAGQAAGPTGITYDDLADAYLTYDHVAARVATYADLATGYGF